MLNICSGFIQNMTALIGDTAFQKAIWMPDGSDLFGKDVSYWGSALVSLRESKSIMDVLRISFDQLEDTHKEIFLDIACFLYDHDVIYVKEILDFRGFNPEYGNRNWFISIRCRYW